MKHILALFFFLFSFCSLFAQTLYTRQETITITQDSVTLQSGQFRGALLWQRSLDGKNWNNLAGKTKQSLKVIKSDEGYYRAEIIDNNCNPIYSDTAIIKLNTIKNITASAGGNIEMSDKIVLVIPANALQTSGNVSIGSIFKDEQPTIPNDNLEIFGKSYKLELPGDSLLLSLTLTFTLETLPVPIENYVLFMYNGSTYFPIEYTISGNTVTAIIDNINWGKDTTQPLKSTKSIISDIIIVGLNAKQSPPSEQLGLKQISISANGDLLFPEPSANPDSKILLLIHGILSSPSNAWETFIKDVKLQIPSYSKVWTFGYNSNLSIDENAVILKNALAAKTNGVKVDIVAHSMGGLVSRAMIENNNGAKYVNKLITLGTPNLGSPVAAIRGLVGFIVSLDSFFSLTPSYNYETQGLRDLETNSSFIQKMKQNTSPPVPYYLIASTNNPWKYWNPNATWVISGPSDGVVAVSSAQGLPGCTIPSSIFIDNGMAHTQMTNINNDVYPQVLAYLRLSVPNVVTQNISDINSSNAIGGGSISSNGGAVITAKGVCWSTSENPTIGNWKTSEGTGNSSFTSNITGLAANTTYFVRAYATNSQGTAYGNQQSFTTSSPIITQPTVTTNTIADITQTTATSGGNVNSDGGATVTARGICWSTLQNPTTANSKTSNGIGSGSFVSSLTGLTASTNYYVRAYATNSQGTAYGNQQSFTTSSPIITQPTVTTNTITDITQTNATSGGNVTSDGGATVTARGICWSTTTNPTTASSKTTNGSGIGNFTSSLTGLTANTTYYVKAYATNSQGTAYGNQQSFTTSSPIITQPTITTNTIADITQTTATSGGNITSDGGATVTARGVCWNTSENPTTANSKTTNGGGTGSFTSSLTGLTANTPYYVRAYATNSQGTAYGNQVNFTTTAAVEPNTITDIDGNVYHTVTIGSQVWLVENLKTTRYNDGTSIPNVTVNTAWAALSTGAYCLYDNDASNINPYGALYNWYSLNTGKLAPKGWHVPTDAEWKQLEIAMGMTQAQADVSNEWRGTDQGTQMKATSGWYNNGNGTNSSGFTALPAGYRDGNGAFTGSANATWWSSTTREYLEGAAWYRNITYHLTNVHRDVFSKVSGFSIRCVKD